MTSKSSEAMVSSEMGDLDGDSLVMHRTGRPGKIEIIATKPLVTQRDLALAYSPGRRRALPGDRQGSRRPPTTTPSAATWSP